MVQVKHAEIPYVRKIIVDVSNVGIFYHSTDSVNQWEFFL